MAVIVALTLLGACTPGRSTPEEYNADLEEDFVESCTENGGSEEECGCTYGRFEEEIPIERFQEVTDDLEEDPSTLPDDFVAAYTDCIAGG